MTEHSDRTRLQRIMYSMKTAMIGVVLVFGGFGLALWSKSESADANAKAAAAYEESAKANSAAADAAQDTADLAVAQNEKDRNVFCGIFEQFVYSSTPSATSKGEELRQSFAAGIPLLECTPAPNDGR